MEKTPQSKHVLEICRGIRATQRELEAKKLQLREQLTELFACGPAMSQAAQIKFLVDLFFELGASHAE